MCCRTVYSIYRPFVTWETQDSTAGNRDMYLTLFEVSQQTVVITATPICAWVHDRVCMCRICCVYPISLGLVDKSQKRSQPCLKWLPFSLLELTLLFYFIDFSFYSTAPRPYGQFHLKQSQSPLPTFVPYDPGGVVDPRTQLPVLTPWAV